MRLARQPRTFFTRRRVARFAPLVPFVLLLATVTGCQRPVRRDAGQVAQAGSELSEHLADYYGTLANDTERTWELEEFSGAFAEARLRARFAGQGKTPVKLPPLERKDYRSDPVYRAYQTRYAALLARKAMAERLTTLYDAYRHLTDYDASAEVVRGAGALAAAVTQVSHLPLPTIGGEATSVSGGVLSDMAAQAGAVAQNRALRADNIALIHSLTDLQRFFDSEKAVYQSIPETQADLVTTVAQELVDQNAAGGAGLVSDILREYSLSWTPPLTPDPALSQGFEAMIGARAHRADGVSETAAETISRAVSGLITLHQELLADRPLSLAEFAETSGTVAILLRQLGTPATPEDAAGLLTAIGSRHL